MIESSPSSPTNATLSVGYTKDDRLVAHSVDANLGDQKDAGNMSNSVVNAFFGDKMHEISLFNITFGSAQDPFYKDTNFTTYTLLIGLGDAPAEQLSLLVEMVILVGFGLPAIFILLSSIYLVVRRCRRRPEPLLAESNQD